MVGKPPHFFGGFGIGGVFAEFAAFFITGQRQEKGVVFVEVGEIAFEHIIGFDIVSGKLPIIGGD